MDDMTSNESAALQFKNFHRRLCERFGYCHDEKDWQRDQISLIEHIAHQLNGRDSQPTASSAKQKILADLIELEKTAIAIGSVSLSSNQVRALWNYIRSTDDEWF